MGTEVKGGRDASNAHNRAGEADKSHAKTNRARHWTIAMTGGLDAATIAAESSRTDEWFDVEEVRQQRGPDFVRLCRNVAETVGISPIA